MKRQCIKCGHNWNQRMLGIPNICPKCKTREWADDQARIFTKTVKCLKCGYVWLPRSDSRPVVCPKCVDPRWDRPRKIKKEE
jgi:predicted Zn-ribbon and HTH transcriptional regulator